MFQAVLHGEDMGVVLGPRILDWVASVSPAPLLKSGGELRFGASQPPARKW